MTLLHVQLLSVLFPHFIILLFAFLLYILSCILLVFKQLCSVQFLLTSGFCFVFFLTCKAFFLLYGCILCFPIVLQRSVQSAHQGGISCQRMTFLSCLAHAFWFLVPASIHVCVLHMWFLLVGCVTSQSLTGVVGLAYGNCLCEGTLVGARQVTFAVGGVRVSHHCNSAHIRAGGWQLVGRGGGWIYHFGWVAEGGEVWVA